MKNDVTLTKKGIIGVLFLYATITAIILLTIYHQQPGFVDFINILVVFFVAILVLELFEQAIISTLIWRLPLHAFLIAKEIAICLFFSLFSLLAGALIIVYFFGDIPITRLLFNLLIGITFITTLALYLLYNHLNIPKKIDAFYLRLFKKKNYSTTTIKDTLDHSINILIIDLITIFTTILLLANSTALTFINEDITTPTNFFASFDFVSLFIVIAIYVLATHYRIFSNKVSSN